MNAISDLSTTNLHVLLKSEIVFFCSPSFSRWRKKKIVYFSFFRFSSFVSDHMLVHAEVSFSLVK